MKKIVLFMSVAISAAFGLVSCDNDDNVNNNSIVGDWEWVQETVYENGESILADYDHANGCEKDYISFTATGEMSDVYYENTPQNDCVEHKYNGTYTTNGNILTITEDGYVYSVKFSVTNDEMRIENLEGEEEYSFVSILKRK